MSFFRYAAIIFLSLFFLAGCASHRSYETPESLATSYYNYIENKDTASLLNMHNTPLHNSNTQSADYEKFALLVNELRTQFNNKGGIKEIEITRVQYNDDKTIANLDITLHFNDGSLQEDKLAAHKTALGWKLA